MPIAKVYIRVTVIMLHCNFFPVEGAERLSLYKESRYEVMYGIVLAEYFLDLQHK